MLHQNILVNHRSFEEVLYSVKRIRDFSDQLWNFVRVVTSVPMQEPLRYASSDCGVF